MDAESIARDETQAQVLAYGMGEPSSSSVGPLGPAAQWHEVISRLLSTEISPGAGCGERLTQSLAMESGK